MWKSSQRMFRLVAKVQRVIRRRLTSAGMIVGVVLIAAATLGVDTHQTVAYQVFALALALFVVAVVGVCFQRGDFVVRRVLPRVVGAGETFTYRVAVTNLLDSPRDGLMLFEELAEPHLDLAELRERIRIPTYRAWRREMIERIVCEVEATVLPQIGPRSTVEIAVQGEALHRGSQHFKGATVARTESLGLMRSLARHLEPANLLVLPKRYALPPINLPGTRAYQHGGVALASSVGQSEEFISLRDYRPGDSPRSIHWKSFARLGEPVVREYQDEFFERHALVLDTFASVTHDARAFEEAVSIAASFVVTVNTQECLLDLLFVGSESHCYTAGRGQMSAGGMLEILAGVQPSMGKPFRALHDAVVGRRALLTGSICVLLAWDEPRAEFVRRLRMLGVPALVLVVTSSPIEERPSWLHVIQPGRVPEGLSTL